MKLDKIIYNINKITNKINGTNYYKLKACLKRYFLT